MGNNSKIDAIADIVFSKVEINKKENYKEWKKDKERFQEELEIALNEFDNETKKTILFRLEKDAESGQSTFFNSSGNIDIQSIPKITRNIAKQVNEKNINTSKISDTNITKENTMSHEEKVEKIKEEFEPFTKGWSAEDKTFFAESVAEAMRKKKQMEKYIKEGSSQEEAEKRARIEPKDKEFLQIYEIKCELTSITARIEQLKIKDPKNHEIRELEAKKKAMEEKLSKSMEQTFLKMQQIEKFKKQGMTQKEAEAAVGWNTEDKENKKETEIDESKDNIDRNSRMNESLNKLSSKKLVDNNPVETMDNSDKEEQMDKATIIDALDKWTQILSEGPENIEEVEQKIEKLEESHDNVKEMLKRLTKDPKLLEALQSEDAMYEYTEKLFEIQEQLQENDVELSQELSSSEASVYALLGIGKITDKEIQPIYDSSKDRISVDQRQQSKMGDFENSKPISTAQVDELYIVDGVVMKIDEKCSEIAINAQEEGRDPEEALAQYFEAQELENNKKSSREDQEDIEATNGNIRERTAGIQAEEIKTDDSNSIKYFGKTEESRRAILTEKDENGNVTKIQVLKPVQYTKLANLRYTDIEKEFKEVSTLVKGTQELDKSGEPIVEGNEQEIK